MKKIKLNRFQIIIICVTFVVLLFLVSTVLRTFSDYVTRDASKIEGDTVYINDLASDYYYLLGQNYVGDINSNTTNYTESNIKMVTVNYFGYPSSDPTLTGYVSLTEQQNKFVYYKYYPVVNNQITIELIDNPFILRPVGKGFAGWTSSTGTVTQDSQTKTYTLTVSSSTTSVNLYANWQDAKVIFLKGEEGDDNFDGSSDYNAVASWGRAFELLRTNNSHTSDRELNIIVLSGPLNHTINYTRRVTHTWNYSYTYTDNTSFVDGGEYLIEYKNGNNRYALSENYTNISMETLTTTTRPSDNSLWIITHDSEGYLIQNKNSGNYLGYEQYYNDQVAMFVRSTPYHWEYDSDYRTFFTRFNLMTVYYDFNVANTLTNNTSYLIADANSYATNNGATTANVLNNSLANTSVNSESYDESNTWRVNQSGTGYTIYNNNQNRYLNYSSVNGTTSLELSNSSLVWNYDSTNHTLSTSVTHYQTGYQYTTSTLAAGTFFMGYQNGGTTYILNRSRGFDSYTGSTQPSTSDQWTLVATGNNFYIRNSNNQYLRINGNNLTTTTNTWNRTAFTLNNNRLYNGNNYLYNNNGTLGITNQQNAGNFFQIAVSTVNQPTGTETMYLRFNNNNWSLSTTSSGVNFVSYQRNEDVQNRKFYLRYDTTNNNFTFDRSTAGTGLYFATYEENRTMTGTTRDQNISSNITYPK